MHRPTRSEPATTVRVVVAPTEIEYTPVRIIAQKAEPITETVVIVSASRTAR